MPEETSNPEQKPDTEGRWSWSDKLAIALACAGAAMALVLFLVEKTPLTVGIVVACIAGLLIYPILHLVSSTGARIVVIEAMLVLVCLFGWSVWPKKNQIAQNSPPQFQPSPKQTPLQNGPPISTVPQVTPAAPTRKPQRKTAPVTPPGTISQGPGSAMSFGQQGGITAGTVTVDAPPLNITATLAEQRKPPDMSPALAKFAHFNTLTVTPNMQWQPVAFRFLCDQELKAVTVPGVSVGGDEDGISPENPKAGFVYRSESDGAHMPIVVDIYSDVDISNCETRPISVTYTR
jgi:hypothetical protein